MSAMKYIWEWLVCVLQGDLRLDGTCRCPDPNAHLDRIFEARLWGGIIPFLPLRHKLDPDFRGSYGGSAAITCQSCGTSVFPSDLECWKNYLETRNDPADYYRKPQPDYDYRPRWNDRRGVNQQ